MPEEDWEGPGLEAWEAWSPEEAAGRLASVAAPWVVVGGWAIDLALGRVTREHHDLEIAVPQAGFDEIRLALEGFELFVVGDGEVRRRREGEVQPPDRHQNWVLDPGPQRWRLDVMLEPGDDQRWICRHDPTVEAPRAFMVGRTEVGIPFLLPHGALLFKAKYVRPKDEHDFEQAAPAMTDEQRSWLRAALARIYPDHPWIARLRAGG